MISLLKIFAIAITAVILISILKTYMPQFVIPVTLAATILLLYLILDGLTYSFRYILDIYQSLSSGREYLPIILKVLGIAYVTEFAVALCQDAGEKSIANKIELAGKIAIFVAAIPVFSSLLNMLNGLI